MTVIEGTREVGIRPAKGARHRQVYARFVTEAVVACVLGGVTGMVAGIARAAVASSPSGDGVVVDSVAIGLALGVTILVAASAKRAALLRPVDALRYE